MAVGVTLQYHLVIVAIVEGGVYVDLRCVALKRSHLLGSKIDVMQMHS